MLGLLATLCWTFEGLKEVNTKNKETKRLLEVEMQISIFLGYVIRFLFCKSSVNGFLTILIILLMSIFIYQIIYQTDKI